ncbi:hypothetical protein Pint_18979 [Pistacia integerrima]|uniref:Uncharacterized protein n=1 Tax=Pistacia integerrima TaxID=434235 RepID=A0ACC0YZP2_9ROSI|nr:hypothetical protein Pint_18979 [Pistacia integerrima]
MEKTCRKYLHAKIHPILALFCLSSFVHHLVLAVPDQSRYPYQPTEDIFIACGSSDNFISQDGRPILGDNSSQHSPLFEPQNNASTASTAPQQPSSISEEYFLKARLSYSPFTYIFNLTAGQKFIRLYFYPTWYPEFENSKAFFSVKAGSFTLLSNFSASLTAAAIGQDTFFKEFCLSVEEGEKLKHNLYSESRLSTGIRIHPTYSIENSTALETVYRVNIGGRLISANLDTGMFRTWFGTYADYLTYASPGYTYARPGYLRSNFSMPLNFSRMANYTAPAEVYQTAMTMGLDQEINANYNLTWEFPVDSAFTYFVRLHFCEFQIEITKVGDRVFQVDIANETAENHLDIIALVLFIFRRKWKTKSSVSVPISFPTNKSSQPCDSSQLPSYLSSHFSLSEIKVATNNFDDILIIGNGGFGNVYKGWLINNEATPVAIKRLNPGSQQGALEFTTEIEMLSQLRHRHLVSLIGYCNDGGEMILDNIGPESLKKFGEVAVSCLHEDKNKRPSMSEVVYGLEFALQLQKSEEKDDEVGEIDKGKMPVENHGTDDDSDLLFTNYLGF